MLPLLLALALLPSTTFLWLGNRWTIIFSPTMPRIGSVSYEGVTDCGARRVEVYAKAQPSEVRQTLQHELMHVITNCDEGFRDLHGLIYTLSEGLAQIKHDNPSLTPMLP